MKLQVYCNFTTGATEVMHNTEVLTGVDHCREPGAVLYIFLFFNFDVLIVAVQSFPILM